jgi:rRNA-processing protein FCF1
MPFQFKINLDSEFSRLFGEYEIIIPSCVLSELQGLRRSEKFGTSALKLALSKTPPKWYQDFEAELFQKLNNQGIKTGKDLPVDIQILELAKALSGFVVTNDKVLLKKLHANDIRTISLRSRKYLKLNSEL